MRIKKRCAILTTVLIVCFVALTFQYLSNSYLKLKEALTPYFNGMYVYNDGPPWGTLISTAFLFFVEVPILIIAAFSPAYVLTHPQEKTFERSSFLVGIRGLFTAILVSLTFPIYYQSVYSQAFKLVFPTYSGWIPAGGSTDGLVSHGIVVDVPRLCGVIGTCLIFASVSIFLPELLIQLIEKSKLYQKATQLKHKKRIAYFLLVAVSCCFVFLITKVDRLYFVYGWEMIFKGNSDSLYYIYVAVPALHYIIELIAIFAAVSLYQNKEKSKSSILTKCIIGVLLVATVTYALYRFIPVFQANISFHTNIIGILFSVFDWSSLEMIFHYTAITAMFGLFAITVPLWIERAIRRRNRPTAK